MLLTDRKARLFAEILKDPECRIEELLLDKCRAKADKMKLLFEALAHNKSVFRLQL